MPQLMDRNKSSRQPAQPKPYNFQQKVLDNLVDLTAQSRFQQMQEAEAQGVPPSETLKMLLTIYDPNTGQQGQVDPSGLSKQPITLANGGAAPAATMPPGSTTPTAARPRPTPSTGTDGASGAVPPFAVSKVTGPRNPVEFLFGQSHYDPQTGEYRKGGLYNLGPSLSELQKAQELAGEKPLQKGEQQKAEIELFGKVMELRAKSAEELQKKLDSVQKVKSDILHTVDAYNSILTGPAGAVGGAIDLAAGRPSQVQEFETMADSLVFSLGEFITGQGGRSLSDAEQERLKKIFRFERGERRGRFEGKLQAMINLVNARIPSGGAKFPSAKQLLRELDSARSTAPTAGAKSTAPNAFTVGRFQVQVQ